MLHGEQQQDELHAKQTAVAVHSAPGSQQGNWRHAAPAGSGRALRLPLWAPNRQVNQVVGGGCWALLCRSGPAGGSGFEVATEHRISDQLRHAQDCVCNGLAAHAPSAWRGCGGEGKRRQGGGRGQGAGRRRMRGDRVVHTASTSAGTRSRAHGAETSETRAEGGGGSRSCARLSALRSRVSLDHAQGPR